MSELHQLGQHPDADQLSAFIEHALPAHEHEQTLAHLAVCTDCRTVVSLSMPEVEEVAKPQPLIVRRPWFSGWNMAWVGVAAFAALGLVVFQVRHQSASRVSTPPTQLATSLPPESPAPAAHPVVPAPQAVPGAPSAHPRVSAGAAAYASAIRPAGSVDLEVAAGIGQTNGMAGLASTVVRQVGGSIQGTITDPSGAAVSNAEIVATNRDTGVQARGMSGDRGTYFIQPLQPGPYVVEVVAKGFERLLQENVAVNNAAPIGLNMKLNVGSQNETVTITNAPPMLATSDATLGGTIDNELYSQLPLAMNGGPRNPTAFQYLMPGVQENPAQAAAKSAATAQAANAGNSGIYGGTGQTNLNENYLEGVPAATPKPQQPTAAPATGASIQTATDSASSAAQAGGAGAGTALGGAGRAAIGGSANGSGFGVRANAPAALAAGRSVALQLPLPSGLATLSATTSGQRVLAIDSSNTLFLSNDGGLHWTMVANQWKSRAVKVSLAATPQTAAPNGTVTGAVPPPPPAAATAAAGAQAQSETNAAPLAQSVQPAPPVFEITTDTGEHWVSADGQTWKHK